MTFLEKYDNISGKIQSCMQAISIPDKNIINNKNNIPEDLKSGFKAGIYSLNSVKGDYKTHRQHTKIKIGFDIFLIVDADKEIVQPDRDLFELVEDFRTQYKASFDDDFDEVEYYAGLVKSNPVKIAKIRIEI